MEVALEVSHIDAKLHKIMYQQLKKTKKQNKTKMLYRINVFLKSQFPFLQSPTTIWRQMKKVLASFWKKIDQFSPGTVVWYLATFIGKNLSSFQYRLGRDTSCYFSYIMLYCVTVCYVLLRWVCADTTAPSLPNIMWVNWLRWSRGNTMIAAAFHFCATSCGEIYLWYFFIMSQS